MDIRKREYKETKKEDVSHVIQTEELDRQEEEGNAMKGGKSLSAGNQIKSSSLGSDERSCPFHPVFSADRNRLFVSVFLWLQASVRSDDQENGITDKTYIAEGGDRECDFRFRWLNYSWRSHSFFHEREREKETRGKRDRSVFFFSCLFFVPTFLLLVSWNKLK